MYILYKHCVAIKQHSYCMCGVCACSLSLKHTYLHSNMFLMNVFRRNEKFDLILSTSFDPLAVCAAFN